MENEPAKAEDKALVVYQPRNPEGKKKRVTRRKGVLVPVLLTVIAILLLFIAGAGIFVYAKMSGTAFDQKTFSFAERLFLGGNVVKPERVKNSLKLSDAGVHYLKVVNALDGKTIQPFYFVLNPQGEQEKRYLPQVLKVGEDYTFSCSGLSGVHFWVEVQEDGEPIKELRRSFDYLKGDTGSSSEDPYVWKIDSDLQQG